ncbi:MAG: hypothetical protein ABI893_11300 [Polaromonas sp.]
MTAKNTEDSKRTAKPGNRIVRALLSGVIAAGSVRHRHALQKREQVPDNRDLDQRVRECGEW